MLNFRAVIFLFAMLITAFSAHAQSADACSEVSGSLWLDTPAVFGRVTLNGAEENAKPPKVAVVLVTKDQERISRTLDRSGKFCFRDVDGSGGVLLLEVEGVEVGRHSLPVRSGRTLKQFQQDFEISIPKKNTAARPGIVSAKFQYKRGPENETLFREASDAIDRSENKKALRPLRKIVASDDKDFVAWMQLGSVLAEIGDHPAAADAYQKALAAKPDLVIAMTGLGRVRMLQGRYDVAIQTLNGAVKADPNSARAYRLLGEAYIMDRKGTLGVEALNEAIRLEPVAMADGHLLMAKLYDLAGAKAHASREYRLFLQKVPQHPEAKKFAKYIEEHPDEQ